MATHNPIIIKIDTLSTAKEEIKKIGSDPAGVEIMAPKMISKAIKLHDVILQDAIILKQDMLSVGGEVAIPRDAFSLQQRTADILVVGTMTHLHELVEKLSRHYPRIQAIASELASVLRETP